MSEKKRRSKNPVSARLTKGTQRRTIQCGVAGTVGDRPNTNKLNSIEVALHICPMKILAAILSLAAILTFGVAPLHASSHVNGHTYQHGSYEHQTDHSSDFEKDCSQNECEHEAKPCCDVGSNHCNGATLSNKKSESAPYQCLSVVYIDQPEHARTLPKGIETPPPRN